MSVSSIVVDNLSLSKYKYRVLLQGEADSEEAFREHAIHALADAEPPAAGVAAPPGLPPTA